MTARELGRIERAGQPLVITPLGVTVEGCKGTIPGPLAGVLGVIPTVEEEVAGVPGIVGVGMRAI